MAEIEIPFRADMRKAIADGAKCCTSRNKRYGKIGDTFRIDGRTYRLTDVRRLSLYTVAQRCFGLEGVNSPQEFETLWADIHPRKGWDPEQLVWTHFFEEVTP
jgi:hypothetical protein